MAEQKQSKKVKRRGGSRRAAAGLPAKAGRRKLYGKGSKRKTKEFGSTKGGYANARRIPFTTLGRRARQHDTLRVDLTGANAQTIEVWSEAVRNYEAEQRRGNA